MFLFKFTWSMLHLIALRYLRSPRQGGFISVVAGFSFLGVMLGVAALVVVTSVMNGFHHDLLSRVIGVKGHILVFERGGHLSYEPAFEKDLKNISDVTAVFPLVDRHSVLLTPGYARGVHVFGITQEGLKNKGIHVDKTFNDDRILIGKKLAEQLNLKEGDTLSLLLPEGTATPFGMMPKQKRFTIHTLFHLGMYEFDKNILFLPLKTAQSFFNLKNTQIDQWEIFLKDIDKTPQALEKIRTLIYGTSKGLFAWQHDDAQIFNALKVEKNVMFLILLLIVLVAAFNIISSLMMLVKEKNKDIAILKTMGTTNKTILFIFLICGLTLGGFGATLGVILGLLFSFNIDRFRIFLENFSGGKLFSEEIYFLSHLPAKICWHDVIFIFSLALVLSFLATLYPAWRASKLDPSQILRDMI